MLKSIRAKIVFITFSMLLILGFVLSFFAYSSYVEDKKLMIKGCDLKIETFAQQANMSIGILQAGAKSLAMAGEAYYNSPRIDRLLNYFAVKNLYNHPSSLGGGLWFEPYHIRANQKYTCAYAYRQKNGKIKLDERFSTQKYNYPNQEWYKEIKKTVYNTNTVEWSKPYYDETGSSSLMTTVGAPIFDDYGKFVGMSTVDWKLQDIIKKISTMNPTEHSFALFADSENDFVIVDTDFTTPSTAEVGKPLSKISWYNENLKNQDTFEYKGYKFISFVRKLDNGMLLVINVPEQELFQTITRHLYGMMILLVFTSLLVSTLTFLILKKNVNKPIDYLRKVASEIGAGNLEKQIEIEEPIEFADLAKSINKMTFDIKAYISNLNQVKAEREKYASELNIAKSIQKSALPNIFPPYPNRSEFDIFAQMDTAKEVGGDFYDFFFIDPDHLMFLIADVSGKGVPAALLMMNAKMFIKSLSKTSLPLNEVMEKVNRHICKRNGEGFFITVFACVLELSSGNLTCVNGGHNPPLLRENDGKYEYFKVKPNLVLGALNMIKYNVFETKLNPGDEIFLYTDGVTEAMNSDGNFYGEARLANILNSVPKNEKIERIISSVKIDVDKFSKTEELTDDMTMLVLRYNGMVKDMKQTTNEKTKTKTFLLPASVERLEDVTSWLEQACDEEGVAPTYKMKLNLALEEIFVNVSSYAYPPKDGDVEIIFKLFDENKIQMTFIDSGTPYNPLEKPDPDITLDAKDRPIGGLGIFMVKKSMDSMDYTFEDGKNILTMVMTYEKA